MTFFTCFDSHFPPCSSSKACFDRRINKVTETCTTTTWRREIEMNACKCIEKPVCPPKQVECCKPEKKPEPKPCPTDSETTVVVTVRVRTN
ncbi:hypothetical protein AYI70_g608 [Smittium culicis]|uniref:Uncharacterized protein n=1 Tax=Smittium culicis TaxID=133412 RepID=A0A1R1YG31_9FUNG|nr:hypothetical protein AYI70_g608 [Smittium culicis]